MLHMSGHYNHQQWGLVHNIAHLATQVQVVPTFRNYLCMVTPYCPVMGTQSILDLVPLIFNRQLQPFRYALVQILEHALWHLADSVSALPP